MNSSNNSPAGHEDARATLIEEAIAYLDAITAPTPLVNHARQALVRALAARQPVGVDAARQRDLLADAIGKAAIKSGIYRADLPGMTGPQLLMACDDMAECINGAQETAKAVDLEQFRAPIEAARWEAFNRREDAKQTMMPDAAGRWDARIKEYDRLLSLINSASNSGSIKE